MDQVSNTVFKNSILTCEKAFLNPLNPAGQWKTGLWLYCHYLVSRFTSQQIIKIGLTSLALLGYLI